MKIDRALTVEEIQDLFAKDIERERRRIEIKRRNIEIRKNIRKNSKGDN